MVSTAVILALAVIRLRQLKRQREQGFSDSTTTDTMSDYYSDESADPLEESGCTVSSDEEEIDEGVAEDMQKFEESFKGITKRYRLLNRIGEGKDLNLHAEEVCLSCLRNILNCLQSRRPPIRPLSKQLGH